MCRIRFFFLAVSKLPGRISYLESAGKDECVEGGDGLLWQSWVVDTGRTIIMLGLVFYVQEVSSLSSKSTSFVV